MAEHVKEQRPPVPRLVFAEEAERVIQNKKNERDSAKKSARGSGGKKTEGENNGSDRTGNNSDPRTSGSRKIQRDRFEEALRNGQWSNDPAVVHAVNSMEEINLPTTKPDSSKRKQNLPKPTSADKLSSIPPDQLLQPQPPPQPPPPPLPIAVSISVNHTEIYRAESDTATIRSTPKSTRIDTSLEPPTLEPIPQVLPRIVHEPERREENDSPELPYPLAPIETPSPLDRRRLLKDCGVVAVIFILPIVFVLGLVNIPLAQISLGLSGNLVYLLAYFPLWTLPSSVAMFLFLKHQLHVQHPDLDKPSLLWSTLTVISQAIFMPLTYFIISTAAHRFPLPFGTFVVLPVAWCIFSILAFFTIADAEQRRMPGFLKNFLVNLLVLLIVELQRLVTVAFVFFFPQIDDILQMLIVFSFHTLVFALRWLVNLMITRFLFKGRSINQYLFGIIFVRTIALHHR